MVFTFEEFATETKQSVKAGQSNELKFINYVIKEEKNFPNDYTFYPKYIFTGEATEAEIYFIYPEKVIVCWSEENQDFKRNFYTRSIYSKLRESFFTSDTDSKFAGSLIYDNFTLDLDAYTDTNEAHVPKAREAIERISSEL
ncbi:hypothetical protein SAMN05421781_0511 [Marinococcus luteus]|uniref:Uncharacterized protein n=1 Tax=Marinococcus luteus TaxID=1122204 RepID=A0A1H2QY30_9BACI|nr:hypothetical protein [Marinococcus luteus]SDW12015.1 hypothetical protein SAMN05421781_0511 [Marinococcus luteus]